MPSLASSTTAADRPGSKGTVSVLLAAHNEAATIASVIAGVRTVLPDALEVVVVDDGSGDATAALAEAAGARVIRLHPNRGKGVALRTAIQASHGDWLVLIDADGQDDPADITLLLAATGDGVAMVNGSRFIGRLHRGAISLPNRLGNLAFTGLLDLLYGARITDSQAGFRAVRGDLARGLELSSVEYEIETEMLAALLRSGLRVVEVPVERYPRGGGETDFRRVRNGLRILRTMISGRLRRR